MSNSKSSPFDDGNDLSIRATSDSQRRYTIGDSPRLEIKTKLSTLTPSINDDSRPLNSPKGSQSPTQSTHKHTSKDLPSPKLKERKHTKRSKQQHEKLPKNASPKLDRDLSSNTSKSSSKSSEFSPLVSQSIHSTSSQHPKTTALTNTTTTTTAPQKDTNISQIVESNLPREKKDSAESKVITSESKKRHSAPLQQLKNVEISSATVSNTTKSQNSFRCSLNFGTNTLTTVEKTQNPISEPKHISPDNNNNNNNNNNKSHLSINSNDKNVTATKDHYEKETFPQHTRSGPYKESNKQFRFTVSSLHPIQLHELLEETEEDVKTMQHLKSKRDTFIRKMSFCNLEIDPSGMTVTSHLSSSSSESSDDNEIFDWDHTNDDLTKQIEEQGTPLPEEAKIVSNLAFLVKVPTWRDEEWIQDLERQQKTKEFSQTSSASKRAPTPVSSTSSSLLSSSSVTKSEPEKSVLKSQSGSQLSNVSKPLSAPSNRRQGMVLQKGPRARWKRRWMKLEGGKLYIFKNDINVKEPKHIIPLLFSQCKVVGQRDKLFVFELFTPEKKFTLATRVSSEMNNWVTAIQTSCDDQMLQSLDVPSSNSSESGFKESSTVTSPREDIKSPNKEILELAKLPHNSICADCEASDPQWAVINIGTFVCIDCSGVHRSLGAHFSKVRSINYDNWDSDLVSFMRQIGNKVANEVWEGNVPPYREKPKKDASRETRQLWITSKYVKREFFNKEKFDLLKNSVPSLVLPEVSPSSQHIFGNLLLSNLEELKKAILTLLKEDLSFRRQLRSLIFDDHSNIPSTTSSVSISRSNNPTLISTTPIQTRTEDKSTNMN